MQGRNDGSQRQQHDNEASDTDPANEETIGLVSSMLRLGHAQLEPEPERQPQSDNEQRRLTPIDEIGMDTPVEDTMAEVGASHEESQADTSAQAQIYLDQQRMKNEALRRETQVEQSHLNQQRTEMRLFGRKLIN